MISTKGRYALRVMVDLAEHANGEFVPMKVVSKRQGISLKYLEKIMPALTAAGLVEARHGKGGGYRFALDPRECTVESVLLASGEKLVSVSCLLGGDTVCERASFCRTLPMWKNFDELVSGFFGKITLADLAKREYGADYVI